MKVEKFHQFVVVEKGPVNSAVIDMLAGNLYQVESSVIAALEKGKYEEIPEFMTSARDEGLIIEIDEKRWLPCADLESEPLTGDEENEIAVELNVEDGADLDTVLERLRAYTISRVVFYGQQLPKISRPDIEIVKEEKDFGLCVETTRVNGNFDRFSETSYRFNKKYNRCWGCKLAVSKEGKVKPCIHSTIVLGDIVTDDVEEIVGKMDKYWTLTKDRVEKCKVCELRYICFDCRELAYRENGDLFSAHPTCNYDPYKGTWHEQE